MSLPTDKQLGHTSLVDLLKTAVTIIAAAGSAYGAIKVDLARTMGDVAYLQQTAQRHENAIEKLREDARLEAVKQANQQARRWPER